VGFWDVSNNIFDNAGGSQPTVSTGTLVPPYPYTIDDPTSLPSQVEQIAGVGKL
jgi:hypothetical protein